MNVSLLLRLLALPSMLAVAAGLAGCQAVGWVGQAVGGGTSQRQVKAQYTGLSGKTVAVIVAADDFTLFRYPEASFKVGRAVSARLSDELPGVRVVDPRQIQRFQNENPYWNTLLVSDLIKRLGTERLVYIDLVEYETHEAGNRHVGQGKIVANVNVLEADAASRGLDPDQFAFSAPVQSLYPEDTSFGVLDADPQTLELAVVSIFSRDVLRLFRDHTIETPK